MRINLLTSFAAGIFIATSISGTAYLFGNHASSMASAKTKQTQILKKVQPTESEMKNELTSAGYIVQTKAEYDNNIKNAAAGAQKKVAPAGTNKSQKIVYRTFVTVSEGMTSIDVGKMLVKAKIIPNAFKFSQDIQSKGLENGLRPGTFEVDTQMSYGQIISTIFKK